MQERQKWEGSASDLLTAANDSVDERTLKSDGWPKTPRALSNRLRRAASFLRKAGVDVQFERDPTTQKRTRTIRMTNTRAPSTVGMGKSASEPSEPSEPSRRSNEVNDMDHQDLFGTRTVWTQTDPVRTQSADDRGNFASKPNPLNITDFGRLDGSDAKSPVSQAAGDGGMPEIPGPSNRRPYEILLGGAGGERCTVCGGGAFVRKIRYNGQINYWHQNCADKYIADLAKGASRPVGEADPDSSPATSNATPQKGNGASKLSPEEVVLAAKAGGAEFNLFDDPDRVHDRPEPRSRSGHPQRAERHRPRQLRRDPQGAGKRG